MHSERPQAEPVVLRHCDLFMRGPYLPPKGKLEHGRHAAKDDAFLHDDNGDFMLTK